jgi:meiotically up-regulated gene 157 (Mug157) protein
MTKDQRLADLLLGVLNRQCKQLSSDPYANAFKLNAKQPSEWHDTTKPPMSSVVWEGKYELDSLAAFLKVSISILLAQGESWP